jgi:hypothetical protein
MQATRAVDAGLTSRSNLRIVLPRRLRFLFVWWHYRGSFPVCSPSAFRAVFRRSDSAIGLGHCSPTWRPVNRPIGLAPVYKLKAW